MTLQPTAVNQLRAALGEHPVRLPGTEIAWVDIETGDLFRLDEKGETRVQSFADGIAAVAPCQDGGVVVALSTALARIDLAGNQIGELITPQGMVTGDFFNDGACDLAGRFLVGTSTSERTAGAARLYALEPDGSTRVVLDGVTESNGIAWSADGRTMYYVDSGTQDLLAYDYDIDAGRLGRSRVLATIDPVDGVPDGIAVDRNGDLWLGLWSGWGIRRYADSGELKESIRFPVQHVTCAGFGGQDLSVLYVATASSYLSPEELDAQPLAGALFRLEVPVAGLPVSVFG